jgi:hypothetical protein
MPGQNKNQSYSGHCLQFPRGPEVESWFGAEEETDPAIDNEWPLLPFMALSDGAHV